MTAVTPEAAWSTWVGAGVLALEPAPGLAGVQALTTTGMLWTLGRDAGEVRACTPVVPPDRLVGVSAWSSSPDGRWAVGDLSGELTLTTADGDVASRQRLRGSVAALEWDPEGLLLAVAAARDVAILDADGAEVAAWPFQRATASDGCWLSDGSLFVGGPGGVRRYSPEDAAGCTEDEDRDGVVTRLAPSPDGRFLAVGDRRRTLRLLDLTDDDVEEMSGFGDGVVQVAWTSPSDLLALSVGAVSRWAVDDDGLSEEGPSWIEGHAAAVTVIGVGEPGHGPAPLVRAVTGDVDGVLLAWDAHGELIERHEARAAPTALSVGEDLVAVGLKDGRVVGWRPCAPSAPPKSQRRWLC